MVRYMVNGAMKHVDGLIESGSSLGSFGWGKLCFARELLTEDILEKRIASQIVLFLRTEGPFSSTLTYEAHTFGFANVCRASVRSTGEAL